MNCLLLPGDSRYYITFIIYIYMDKNVTNYKKNQSFYRRLTFSFFLSTFSIFIKINTESIKYNSMMIIRKIFVYNLYLLYK